MGINESFAKFLKDNDLTNVALAAYLGVSNQYISQILNSQAKLSKKTLGKILGNDQGWDTSALLLMTEEQPGKRGKKPNYSKESKIPLYDARTIGGLKGELANTDPANIEDWVDAGDWFPTATAAIRHYGDSMREYPAGSILVLKRVEDTRLLLNGHNYVIETPEYRITKQIQYDGGDFLMAYSTNLDTYPNGRQIHSPIRIPVNAVLHMDLVIGCVVKEYSNGARPVVNR